RSPQMFVEGVHGFFAAHVAEHAVRLERFAAPSRHALQFKLGVIAVGDRAGFDRNKCCGAVTQLLNRLIDLGVPDFEVIDFHFEVFILSEVELWQHLERRAELHRSAFREVYLVDFRPRHGHHFVFGYRALDLLGHQRLQHFALDVFGEPAADQRHRRLPRAESRHARHAGKFPGHAFHRLLYRFRGNFEFKLAPASRFTHGRVFALAAYVVRLSRYIQSHPNVRTSALCRFSVRNKETGKNCERGTTKQKYRGIHEWRQLAQTSIELWCGRRDTAIRLDSVELATKCFLHRLRCLPLLWQRVPVYTFSGRYCWLMVTVVTI